MNTTIIRCIKVGVFLALVILVAMVGLAYRTIHAFADTSAAVLHTHEVRDILAAALAGVQSVETGARGYVITGDSQFLEEYEQGRAAIGQTLPRLRLLVTDNPKRQSQIDLLEPLVEQKLAVSGRNIAIRREQGLTQAAADVATAEGKDIMDRIRAVLATLQAEENRLLAQRLEASRLHGKQTVAMLAGGLILNGLLVLAVILLIRRDWRIREEAKQELERFFSLSLDFLCISSADGYFKRVSPAVTDTLGWTVEEFLARPFIENVHPEDRPATLREVEAQIVEGRKVLSFENRYRHKDGGWRVLSWKSVPQPGGLMYATARDVTERKENERAYRQLHADLQRRARELEAANAELEAFSYSVSHDLRAPLRHIDGYAQLLRKQAGAQLDASGQRYLDNIGVSARNLGVLIDELLTFSRMGRAEMRWLPVDMGEAVTEVVRTLEPETQGRGITWQVAELPTVRADPVMLRQVWSNLLGNAVKYTRDQPQPCIEIAHRLDQTDGHVFSVRDNGAGFDMQYAAKLFGVFQRLHGANEFEGTGIGLANVRRIIHRHGGRTWAEGTVGVGATFHFSLPAEAAAESAAAAPAHL